MSNKKDVLDAKTKKVADVLDRIKRKDFDPQPTPDFKKKADEAEAGIREAAAGAKNALEKVNQGMAHIKDGLAQINAARYPKKS